MVPTPDCRMSSIPISINIKCDLPAAHDEALKYHLRKYNQDSNPKWWAATEQPENHPDPLSVIASDASGDFAGGLIATSSMSWLRISMMVVPEDFRRQGIGTRLLKAAEAEAVRRSCRYSFLDTMEYQAPGFYLACGYQQVGLILDWDSHGHSKYFFVKSLVC